MEPRRPVVAGLTAAALVLIVVGAAAVVLNGGINGGGATPGAGTTMPGSTSPGVSSSRSAPPSPSHGSGTPGASKPGASVSARPSAEPTQHPEGLSQQGADVVYYAADGTAVPVPAIDGLELKIGTGKAVYIALAGNRFGLAAGTYGGEFMPLVTKGQADGSSAETGAVVMVGAVVSRLTSDQLASISSVQDRWIVALPVDIRSAAKALVRVSFDQFGLGAGLNAPRVLIRFTGAMPVVEGVPGNGGYHVLVEGVTATAWQVIDPTRLTLSSGSIDRAHAMNELVVYGSGTGSIAGTPIRRNIVHDGHVAVGQPLLSAASDVSVSLIVDGSHADLGPSKILSVGDVPVFVASS